MNGIENIIARIEADSEAEIRKIEEETAARCAEIVAKGDEDARNEYYSLLQKGTKEATVRIERLTTVTNLELRKVTLATKQQMVSAAFDRAVEMLTELPEEQYTELLVRLCVGGTSTGEEKLVFSPSDRAKYGKTVCIRANEMLTKTGRRGYLTLSGETRDIKGGLILSNGDIEVNCSAETLVAQLRNDMAAQVAGVLFD